MHGGTRWETLARRLDASDGGTVNPLEFEMVPTSRLRDGDLVLYTAGDLIPATGEVIEGWVAVRITASHHETPIDPR